MREKGWICTVLALIFPIVSLELRVIANIGGIESAAKGKKASNCGLDCGNSHEGCGDDSLLLGGKLLEKG